MTRMDSIEKHFNRLSQMLVEIGVPHWDSTLVVEGLYLDREKKQKVIKNKMYSLQDYSLRFDKLISNGYNWLNLCGLGLLEDTLIIGVELPSSAVGSHFTSVNLAGPMKFVSEHNYQIDKYLEIEEWNETS